MSARNKRIHLGLILLLCIFFVIFSIFVYDWIRFQKQVNIYNNKIYSGMKEDEVISLMGKPKSDNVLAISNKEEKENIEERAGKKVQTLTLLLYEGRFSFRESILIYIDENKRVIFKDRMNMVTFIE